MRRIIGVALAFIFAFTFMVSIDMSNVEARHQSYWQEIRHELRRESIRAFKRTIREYENNYIQTIRDRQRWERKLRNDRYRSQYEAASARYNRSYYSNEPCVYVLTANTYAGDTVELGSVVTNGLSAKEEQFLQLIADHLASGEALYVHYSTDRGIIRRLCRAAGITCTTAGNQQYLLFSK